MNLSNLLVGLVFFSLYPTSGFSAQSPVIWPREHASYFYDSTGTMSLQHVTEQHFASFNPELLRTRQGVHWLKIDAAAQLFESYSWVLNTAYFDQVTFYLPEANGGYKTMNAGWKVDMSDRTLYVGRFHLTRFQLPEGSDMPVYLRIRHFTRASARLSNFSSKRWFAFYSQQEYQRLFWEGRDIQIFTYGALLVMILYNLMLYFYTGRMIYLLYQCILIPITISALAVQGHLAEYGFGEAHNMIRTLRFSAADLYHIGIALFLIQYLKLKSISKYLYYVYGVIITAFAVDVAMGVAGFCDIEQQTYILFNTSSQLMVIISLSWAILKGHKLARFLLPPYAILIVSSLLYLAQINMWLPQNRFTEFSLHLAHMFESVMFSIVLSRKINYEKRRAYIERLETQRLKEETLRIKNRDLESEVIARTKEIKQKNKELQEQKDRELTGKTMQIAQQNQYMEYVKNQLDSVGQKLDEKARRQIRSVTRSIGNTYRQEAEWEDFRLYFERVNPHFFTKLCAAHPGLSSEDLKYCAYLKINMSNREIANLLFINIESVRVHKYRLKKKLGLGKEQELTSYLRQM